MNLATYLRRVRFEAPVSADLETLRALHLAHQLAIPFENLDVQLRRPVSLDLEAMYDKVVTRQRGGWCYELNGLMGWALKEIGFDVIRLSGGVMREVKGDETLGGHLFLLVRLDQPYLVDVGFGGSLAEPLPLRDAFEREEMPYRVALNRIADGYWRFTERTHDTDPFTVDFRAEPADEALIARRCQFQQSDPSSSFVRSLVVQRRTRDTHVSLRGRVLKITHAARTDKTLLDSPEELVTTLREQFDLDVPEAAMLWPDICARHKELFGPET